MTKRIAKSAVAKTFPFDVKKIKLKDISWDVNDAYTTITLEKCNLPEIPEIPKENIGFGLYAYQGNSEAFLAKELDDLKNLPLSFNFIKNGLNIGIEKCRFRVYLFNKNNNKLLASSVDLPLTPKDQQQSMLQIFPGELGNRIAQLQIDDDGPSLLISTNFKTKKGEPIFRQKLTGILKENPSFTCGFFPIILDEIFTKAYLNKRPTWAKKWIALADQLVEGIFDENEKLKTDDIKFKKKLQIITTAWINKYSFDQKLFEQLNKGD